MKELVLSVNCFNLKYTLECGQCFRWKKIAENEYVGVVSDRVIKIRQDKNKLFVRSNNMENIESVVKNYFDLDVEYKTIEDSISTIDDNVKKAVKNTTGIRILNQDYFETLISYIISANNNIPRISKSVNMISRMYGKKVVFEGEDYYLFPTVDELKDVPIEGFRKCGVGFRDTYIYNTIKEILEQNINFHNMSKLPTKQLKEELLKFKGVGSKVADCVLLFSFGRKEVFPIDVWVERVMQILYFRETSGSLKKKDILKYANEHFLSYAGIVQQHLFYNIREKMIEY